VTSAEVPPSHDPAQPGDGHASGPETAAARPGDPAAVLLVEDDSGDAVLIEELLSDSGLRASLVRVSTLGEAMELLSRGGVPSCVLLDLHLPDARGLEAVTQIVTAAPDTAIVVLTGWAEESAGLEAVAAGAQDYLVKGKASPEVFGRAVRYSVQRKQAERAIAALRMSALRAQENARLERGLLSTPLLRTGEFETVARYRPGRAKALVGGDFYDVVEMPDGAVHAVIGDVSGHSAAEAALAACLRVAWRALVLAGTAASTTISLLEQMLVAEREDPDLFATLTHLVFPPGRRRVRIIRAGHPGLLLRTGGNVQWIEPPAGPAIGLLPDGCWPEEELPLPANAGLVLFTDGLFEGHSGPGDQHLGEGGLVGMARELASLGPAAFVDTLIEWAEAEAASYGGLADDVPVMHLGWKVTA
jgi:CheY-like chemotaxis protein